jgi:hypothetical protein
LEWALEILISAVEKMGFCFVLFLEIKDRTSENKTNKEEYDCASSTQTPLCSP